MHGIGLKVCQDGSGVVGVQSLALSLFPSLGPASSEGKGNAASYNGSTYEIEKSPREKM